MMTPEEAIALFKKNEEEHRSNCYRMACSDCPLKDSDCQNLEPEEELLLLENMIKEKQMEDKKGWLLVRAESSTDCLVSRLKEKGYRFRSIFDFNERNTAYFCVGKDGIVRVGEGYRLSEYVKKYIPVDEAREIPAFTQSEFEIINGKLHCDGVVYSKDTIKENMGR